MSVYRGKKPHSMRNPNVKRAKSGEKIKNTVDHYEKLLVRMKKEGETKWLLFAMQMCMKKVKKHNIVLPS